MASNQRTMSESVLEENEGYMWVSGLTAEERQEGDETVGAMKNEVIDLLKLIEPYNNKIQVQSKPGMRASKSLENLDNRIKAPDELRMDSYKKLYNAKVKRFIKGNPQGKSQEDVSNSLNGLNVSNSLNFGLSEHKIRGADIDFAHRTIKGELNSPDITTSNLNAATLDRIRMANKTAKFNLPSLKGHELDVKGGLERPDTSWSSHKFDADVDVPHIEIDGPKANFKGLALPNMDLSSGKSKMAKFKMPDFGHSMKAPEMDVSLPKIKGGINSPNLTAPELDIDVPTGTIKGPTIKQPKVDIRAPDFNIDAPSGNLKMATFKGPNIKGDIGSPDMNLAFPEGDMKGPKLDVKSPDFDIDGLTGKIKMPKMKTPKFGISGFKGRDLDVKGDLERPDVSWSSHKLDADVDVPDIDINGPKADFKGVTLPNIDLPSGKPKMPKFKMPDFGHSIKAPEMDVSLPKVKGEMNSPNITAPEFGIDVPRGTIKGPTIKQPTADIRAPEFNINAPSGKLKMPTFKGPNIKGDIGSPDMNLAFPKADVKGPKLDVKSPDIDIDGSAGKLKMPKLKTPKFSLPGFKKPDINVKGDLEKPDLSLSSNRLNADIDVPDVDINGPNADLKGLTLPDMDLLSGKMKIPKFQMPDFGHSMPNVKAPDMDLSLPKIKGQMNSPNITAPEIDINVPKGKIKGPTLKGPKADIKAPEFNIDAPTGKLKMPNFKGPNIKGDMGSPDMNLAFPKADVKGPKLDVKSPDIDIDGPTGKIKMPKMKTPKFSLSGFKKTDFNVKGDMKGPDFNMSSPKFDADIPDPDIDINGPQAKFKGMTPPNMHLPSGKTKTPKFKLPGFGLSGSKVQAPEMDLSLPKMKGELNSPNLTVPDLDVNVPTGKIKGPTADIRAPEFNIDAPSGKLKMPNFKGPKLKGDIGSPDMNLAFPKAEVKGPKLDVNSPDIDIDGPTGKLNLPKMKTPKFSIPGLKGPDIDVKGDMKGPDLSMSSPKFGADVTGPDLDINGPQAKFKGMTPPNMHLPSGKTKTPKFKLPGFGLSGSKVQAPEMDLSLPKMKGELNSPNLTVPDLDVNVPTGKIKGPNADIRAPEFNIDAPSGKLKMPNFKGPKLKGDIGSPDMNMAFPKAEVKGPKLDVNSPDIDIDGPTGKLNLPKMKTPKFSIPGLKGPDIDVKGDMKGPDFSMSSPKFGADVTGPDLDINGPNANINGVTLPDIHVPSGKAKTPKFMLPGFGLSGPKIKAPEMDLSLPKINGEMNSPNLTAPDFDVNVPTGQIKGPTLKGPNVDIRSPEFNVNAPSEKMKMPNLKGPNIMGDLGSPDMNLAFPEGNVKGPKLDVKSPNIDIDGSTGKIKMPKMKTPKFSIPGFKGPNINGKGDLKGPDLSMSSPEFNADISGPNFDINGPKANINGTTLPNLNLPSGKTKTPKFKLPGFGLSEPKVKAPEVDLSLPKMKGPNLTAPELDVDVPTGKIKGPTLKGPKADIRAPEFNINAPSGKLKMPTFKGPNIKGDIGSPDMNLAFPEGHVKGPKLDVKSPDIDIDGPTGKIKMPKMKTPKFSIPGFKGRDLNVKGDLNRPDLNMSSPKFGADITGPALDIDGPKADVNGMTLPNVHLPSSKTKTPTFKLPDLGLSGPKVRAPEVDLSLPKMKGELNSPNLTVPQLDINVPTGKIKGPTIKEPMVDIRAPDFNIDAPSGKMKVPTFKGPSIRGDIESPDMNLAFPETDMKGPKLDVKSPNVDIGGPTGNFKLPNVKTPKFGISGFKGPDLDFRGDMNGPDLSMSSPKFDADFSGPDIDIDGPKANINGMTLPNLHLPSGKIKTPKINLPDLGLSVPKVKAPEIDLSLPKMKGSLNSPNISVPDLDIDVPTGNIKGPTFKEPKVDIRAPEFKINDPSEKLKMPNFKGPNIGGEIGSPDMNLAFPEANVKGPNLDVKSSDIDIDVPTGKIKLPKLNTPKLSLSGFTGHDAGIQGDLERPDLTLASKKVNAVIGVPDFDIDTQKPSFKGPKSDFTFPDMDLPSGSQKMPGHKMPQFMAPEIDASLPQIKGDTSANITHFKPNISSLDFDGDPTSNIKIRTPKVDIKGLELGSDMTSGKLKGQIHGQDIRLSLPEAKLKNPKLDLISPDIDINGPAGKLKTPKIQTPTFSVPGFEERPDLSLASLKSSHIYSPDIGIIRPKTSGINMNTPEPDIRAPKLDVKSSEFDIDGPESKFRLPKFTTPKFDIHGFDEPDIKARHSLEGPHLNISAVDSEFEIPDYKAHKPTTNFKGLRTDLTLPDIDLTSGKLNLTDSAPNDHHKSDTKYHWDREKSYGSLKFTKGLESLVSGMELEVPKQSLKGSKLKLLTQV